MSVKYFQEKKQAEEERIRKEREMDYLAPFLARIGDPPELTREMMEEVAEVRCHSLYSSGSFYSHVCVNYHAPPPPPPPPPHTHRTV